jgi:hypothetical protein
MIYEHGSNGGMTLTGENRRTLRITCLSVTLSTRNSKWTDRGANPAHHRDRPATNPPKPWYGQQTAKSLLNLVCTVSDNRMRISVDKLFDTLAGGGQPVGRPGEEVISAERKGQRLIRSAGQTKCDERDSVS